MHDAKGRPLMAGDYVIIAARITTVSETEDYCNVAVQTILGRRPDGAKENISGINTAVLLRANPGDERDLSMLNQPDPGRPVPHHGSGPAMLNQPPLD